MQFRLEREAIYRNQDPHPNSRADYLHATPYILLSKLLRKKHQRRKHHFSQHWYSQFKEKKNRTESEIEGTFQLRSSGSFEKNVLREPLVVDVNVNVDDLEGDEGEESEHVSEQVNRIGLEAIAGKDEFFSVP